MHFNYFNRPLRWLLTCAALAAAVALLGPVRAAQEHTKKSPAEALEALEQEFNAAMQEFQKAYSQAKTDEERQKVFAEKYPNPEKYTARFLKIAEASPKDPAALKALLWVVQRARNGNEAGKALDLLLTHYLESDKLGEVCYSLVYSGGEQAEKALKTMVEKSPHRAVRGMALFCRAMRRQQESGGAEKLFDEVIEQYGDVKAGNRGTLGESAGAYLFEARNLVIGKTAPEIEGEDVEGKKFKLSEYRGKVVVLDFWGDW